MAQEMLFRDYQVTSTEIHVRRIETKDLRESLRKGYQDFNARPTFVQFLVLIYPLFALLATVLSLGQDLLYLAFPIVAGMTLLGPVVSVGLCAMSRRRERGLELTWRGAFDFVHSASFAPIAALSIVMMLLYVSWLFLAQFLYFGLFGDTSPASVGAFVSELFGTRHGAALMLYGTVIGFLYALTALAISAIAFPLMLDAPASMATAVATSARAIFSNPAVMATWGIVVVGLLALGGAVFLIGLGVVLPVLGHASWHLYRKLVET